MKSYSTLDNFSPAKKRLLGIAIAAIGLAAAVLVALHPERLRAPAWLAFVACSCFVIAGTAVALHSTVSRRAYAWAMVVLLAVMTFIPGWIALGPGDRHCTSSVPALASETGCRVAFGVGAVFMAAALLVALVLARKGRE